MELARAMSARETSHATSSLKRINLLSLISQLCCHIAHLAGTVECGEAWISSKGSKPIGEQLDILLM